MKKEASEVDSVESELHFLRQMVLRCRGAGRSRDGEWQIAPVYCSIPHSVDGIDVLRKFDAAIAEKIPMLSAFGRARAKRAYGSAKHSITKPSYVARIRNLCNDWDQCQLQSIADIFEREPNSGGLVFTVFHPGDLLKRCRPGYVPCLVSGSFLKHRGALHLNVFFRSQSVIEFGVYDLLFLRALQSEMVSRLAGRKGRSIRPGPLNLFFGRMIIQRRIARRRVRLSGGRSRHVALSRERAVDEWLGVADGLLGNSLRDQPLSSPRLGDLINDAMSQKRGRLSKFVT